MGLEIDFHNSEVSEVKIGDKQIEIHFSHAVVVSSSAQGFDEEKSIGIKAQITIGSPKYKKLPGSVKLTDGELYGVPGKSLNGRISVDFKYDRDCELVLSDQSNDYTIHGKYIQVFVDLSSLPKELRASN